MRSSCTVDFAPPYSLVLSIGAASLPSVAQETIELGHGMKRHASGYLEHPILVAPHSPAALFGRNDYGVAAGACYDSSANGFLYSDGGFDPFDYAPGVPGTLTRFNIPGAIRISVKDLSWDHAVVGC